MFDVYWQDHGGKWTLVDSLNLMGSLWNHFTRRASKMTERLFMFKKVPEIGISPIPFFCVWYWPIFLAIESPWRTAAIEAGMITLKIKHILKKGFQSSTKCYPILTRACRSRQASSRRSWHLEMKRKPSSNIARRVQWFLMIKTFLELPNRTYTFPLSSDIGHQVFLVEV